MIRHSVCVCVCAKHLLLFQTLAMIMVGNHHIRFMKRCSWSWKPHWLGSWKIDGKDNAHWEPSSSLPFSISLSLCLSCCLFANILRFESSFLVVLKTEVAHGLPTFTIADALPVGQKKMLLGVQKALVYKLRMPKAFGNINKRTYVTKQEKCSRATSTKTKLNMFLVIVNLVNGTS